MIEFILGVYLSWWFIMSMCIILPFTYYNEYDVLSLFILTLFVFAIYLISNISLVGLGVIMLGYIPVGISWSIFRWKRRGDAIVEEINSSDLSSYERNDLIKSLKPENNISYITSVILGWPFSVLENVLSDVFLTVKKLVKDRLINIYKNISDKQMNEIYEELD